MSAGVASDSIKMLLCASIATCNVCQISERSIPPVKRNIHIMVLGWAVFSFFAYMGFPRGPVRARWEWTLIALKMSNLFTALTGTYMSYLITSVNYAAVKLSNALPRGLVIVYTSIAVFFGVSQVVSVTAVLATQKARYDAISTVGLGVGSLLLGGYTEFNLIMLLRSIRAHYKVSQISTSRSTSRSISTRPLQRPHQQLGGSERPPPGSARRIDTEGSHSPQTTSGSFASEAALMRSDDKKTKGQGAGPDAVEMDAVQPSERSARAPQQSLRTVVTVGKDSKMSTAGESTVTAQEGGAGASGRSPRSNKTAKRKKRQRRRARAILRKVRTISIALLPVCVATAVGAFASAASEAPSDKHYAQRSSERHGEDYSARGDLVNFLTTLFNMLFVYYAWVPCTWAYANPWISWAVPCAWCQDGAQD